MSQSSVKATTMSPGAVRMLLVTWLILAPCAAPSAYAGEDRWACCSAAQNGGGAALRERLDDVRTNDGFYRQLVAWKGPPASCNGSVGTGPAVGESRLLLSWPDGATFEQLSMPPEIFVVRYRSPQGLARPDAIVAALREDAVRRGLHVDWTVPRQETEGGTRIVEYHDPDPSVNGIVRLVYDRQDRLVAVSLSLAP